MTLIAAFKDSGVSVIIGDVLVSRLGVEEPHVDIPSRDDVSAVLPESWNRNICGTYPKLILINPLLAIGLAGASIAAKAVAAEIRALFPGPDFSAESFFEYLKGIENLGSAIDLSLVGLIVIDGNPVAFRWDSSEPEKVETGEEFTIGSGSEFFEKILSERVENKISDGNTPLDTAVLNTLGIIGSLMSDEIVSGDNLLYLFGGGYQIIVYDGNRLVYVDDYLIVFLPFLKVGHDVRAVIPRYFLKFKYLQNNLTIKRITFGNNNTPGILDDFYISAFIVTLDRLCVSDDLVKELISLPLRSMFYCCVALLPIDNDTYACAPFCFPDGHEGFVHMEKVGTKEQISFHRDLFGIIVPELINLAKCNV